MWDKKTQRVVKKIINEERPDLIIITGDLLSGDNMDGRESTFNECWQLVIELFDSF